MKTLLQDHNPGARAVRVVCLHCGKMETLGDLVFDPDGPAFQAYYHRGCAGEVFGNFDIRHVGGHVGYQRNDIEEVR